MTANIKTAAKCILINPKAMCRVQWESIPVLEKKTRNYKKLKQEMTMRRQIKKSLERTKTYQKEQLERYQRSNH